MKSRHLIALGLLAVMIVWMAIPREHSGVDERYRITGPDSTIHALSADDDAVEEPGTFAVRVRQLQQDAFTETVRVRGRTQALRHVSVRAETSGRVVATPVRRGARVEEGEVLCRIAVDGREADLQEALSREEEARLQYEGELDLQRRGLQGRSAIAERRAALDAAKAAVERARLALERTVIRAPFDGVMESRDVEVGDNLDTGGECATMLDDQTMLVRGTVAEHQVDKLSLGAPVEGRLVGGDPVRGEVTYISRAGDPASRSYRIEVELETDGKAIRQGVTAEIRVAAEQIQAHLVPPSSLTLDDNGDPGVKVVDRENRVQFLPVTIVGENTGADQPGFWVTGLPPVANVITLGQEIVFPGQVVRSDFR